MVPAGAPGDLRGSRAARRARALGAPWQERLLCRQEEEGVGGVPGGCVRNTGAILGFFPGSLTVYWLVVPSARPGDLRGSRARALGPSAGAASLCRQEEEGVLG